jgi:hypothetical protein
MDKLVKLVQMLQRRAASGDLKWEETVQDDYYQTAFPNYVLRIGPRPGRGNDTDYVIQILNANNVVIEEFTDVDIDSHMEGGGASFGAMRNLHEAARRSAMGADKALDEILNELGDDIPF